MNDQEIFDGHISQVIHLIMCSEIKRVAISSLRLLHVWKIRYDSGAKHPLKNGFKITPEHRHEQQAVFRLSVSRQIRRIFHSFKLFL